MTTKDQPLFLRVLIVQDVSRLKSQFWCLKSMFAITIGYSIGFLISDLNSFDYISIEKNMNNSIYYENEDNQTTDIPIPTSIKDKLYNEVKILCWIMTYPENHKTSATQVLKTWGKRCNKILLMSSKDDKELGIIGLPVNEGRDNLWPKTKEAFKYIYKNHFREYDWFLKADDDTYVIVENLRLLLYEYDPRTPIYFGYRFNAYVKQGYMSGGAGYVLSKEALERFIVNALPNKDICGVEVDGPEDFEIGNCLQNVGVIAGDSRDIDNRGRFFIFPPEVHLLNQIIDLNYWYWEFMYDTNFEGLTCCSDNTISFHYIKGKEMVILDYLIYNVKPFGIVMGNQKLPENIVYIPREIPKKN